MSPIETIFPFAPRPPSPAGESTQVIETVGVEVVEVIEAPPAELGRDWKTPANGNGVIPFASTLRRVG